MANAYFECRKRTQMSRQTAAIKLGVSESSLASYEQGTVKKVPTDIVASMAKLYNAPELKRRYCKECPMSKNEPIAVMVDSVAGAVLHFIESQDCLAKYTKLLVEIGKDNAVSVSEASLLKQIVANLSDLCMALSEIRFLGERYG